MEKRYCPKCKKFVDDSEVQDKFHTCGCFTVPAWSEAKRIEIKYENLRQRIITTLNWMVKDAKWRADETKLNIEEGSQGGYSSELQEAINLLKELKDG